MLSGPSQVLQRNSELFSEGRWLLVNPTEATIFSQLAGKDIEGFHQFYDVFQACENQYAGGHRFGAALVADNSQAQSLFDGIVVYMPKAKAHLQMLLANISEHLKVGGLLMLVGENNAGVKSAAKFLSAYGSTINKLDSARRCSLFSVVFEQPGKRFCLDDWLSTTSVSVNDTSIEVCSLPGVFSHGELDAGTQLLLQHCSTPTSGKILDFACGAGVIGSYLARKFPGAEWTMSDVNALALYAAGQTAKRNGVQVNVIAANGLSGVDKGFAAIVTNPPFHTGVKTDYNITESFIASARQHINKGGKLVVVANRFLPYPDQLQKAFGNVATIAQTGKFNLYQSNFY